MDNFKSLLVAWIIGCHALLGYTAIGGWPYDEVNEVTMSPALGIVAVNLPWSHGRFSSSARSSFWPVYSRRLRWLTEVRHISRKAASPDLDSRGSHSRCRLAATMWLAYRSAGHRPRCGKASLVDSLLGLGAAVVRPGADVRLARLRAVALEKVGPPVPNAGYAGQSSVPGRPGHCCRLVRRTPVVPGPQPANLGPASVAVATVSECSASERH